MKMKGIAQSRAEEKTGYYLRLVHLSQFKNSYIHQLSGGMRQRVALARALATEPDVLLMDEPFAALDAQTRDLLHDELERIWAETGRTIIFVTHNVREAVRLGDRVALLYLPSGRSQERIPVESAASPSARGRNRGAELRREILDRVARRDQQNPGRGVQSASHEVVRHDMVFYAALVGVVARRLQHLAAISFPHSAGVLESLRAGFADHSFWIAIAVSMKRMLLGYAISVVIGMDSGLGVASNKFLEETMGGLLVSLQSLPSICWLPLAVLWFGLSEKAILFVVVMGSLLSVTITMEDGRKQMPKIYGMAGRNLGARGFKLFLVRAVAGQPALHSHRPEAGLGVCLALPDFRGDDFRQSGSGAAPHDGPRPERYEPGHRGDDADHCDWLHGRRPDLQDLRAAAAVPVGTGAG